MRTARQWTKVIMPTIDDPEITESVIVKIQKEAYNHAISDAFNKMADIAEIILKLKK